MTGKGRVYCKDLTFATNSSENTLQFCFSTLLPRANAWLRDKPDIALVKCETAERKIWNLEQTNVLPVKFEVPSDEEKVYYLKGLRCVEL